MPPTLRALLDHLVDWFARPGHWPSSSKAGRRR
jgi:hypothetical protein